MRRTLNNAKAQVQPPPAKEVEILDFSSQPSEVAFGNWLYAQMQEKGIGPQKLASDIGIEASMVSKHTGNPSKGRLPATKPSITTLAKYASYFHADVKELALMIGIYLPEND
jgi:hypothetical protein